MFNLIKKDFITTIKLKGIIYLILISIILTFVLPGAAMVGTVIIPVGISYLSIMNTFYYDNFNNSNEFILSIPTKREDIVYSRYIFSLIMIVIAVIISHILFGGLIFNFINVLTFKDVTFAMIVLFLGFSIIIPLIYKFGYGKMRIISPGIILVIYFITTYIFSPIDTKMRLVEQYGSFPITISGASMEQDYSKFYAFIVDSINIDFVNYTTVTIFMLVVFIISMFISSKIYAKRTMV